MISGAGGLAAAGVAGAGAADDAGVVAEGEARPSDARSTALATSSSDGTVGYAPAPATGRRAAADRVGSVVGNVGLCTTLLAKRLS